MASDSHLLVSLLSFSRDFCFALRYFPLKSFVGFLFSHSLKKWKNRKSLFFYILLKFFFLILFVSSKVFPPLFCNFLFSSFCFSCSLCLPNSNFFVTTLDDYGYIWQCPFSHFRGSKNKDFLKRVTDQ